MGHGQLSGIDWGQVVQMCGGGQKGTDWDNCNKIITTLKIKNKNEQ